MSSGQYSRYMDKSLDEMAAEMRYPSDSPHHLGHTQTYGEAAPTYSDSKATSREEVYRDRATTRYVPFSGEVDSYPDEQGRSPATEREPAGMHDSRRDDKDECTLFVSNLNYDTSWQRLKDHMKKGGSVGRCDVFRDMRGHSKGVGQCVFNDLESTDRALQELNDTVLEGRRIKLRKALSHEHRDKELVGDSLMRRKGKPLPDPARTIFVHNLDYSISWQKLKDIFKVVGPVVDVEIMENHKGNARVQFNSTTDAVKAIALFHGQMLMDRPMRLRMDSKAPFQPDPLKLKLASLPSHSDYNISPPRRHRSPSPELSYLSMSRDRSYGYAPSHYGDELRDYDHRYRRELAEVAYMKEVTRDRDDLYYNRSRELDRRPTETSSRSYDRRYGRSRSRSRERTETGRMERSGELDGDNIKSVFVKNLPFQTTWQSLKDEFRKAGDVRRADVKTGRDGRPLGCGLVLFDTHKDASNAVDMFNNKMFDGRQIEVRFDRMSH